MTMTYSFDEKDIPGSVNRFRRWRNKAELTAPLLAQNMATAYQDAVKRHASGRPGPEIVTGAYVGGIMAQAEDATTWVVFTDEPQAHRLEMGFTGTDALGRHYHQPAFPHWRPAMIDLRSSSPAIYSKWLKEVFSGN